MADMILSSNDFYTTVIDNEIIKFTYPLSSISIEAKNKIPIKINNTDIINTSLCFINEMIIVSIQIMAPIGTEVKWSGTAS